MCPTNKEENGSSRDEFYSLATKVILPTKGKSKLIESRGWLMIAGVNEITTITLINSI